METVFSVIGFVLVASIILGILGLVSGKSELTDTAAEGFKAIGLSFIYMAGAVVIVIALFALVLIGC